ncbi:MerR family transcriptional regulator [Microlunatus lacustris]
MAALEGSMQIGVVAERTAMSIPTLRHYDEVGLVTPSARSEGGFRLYTEDDVQRILVIRRMKPLEFTLAEMRELLEALDVLNDTSATAEEVQSAQAVLVDCRQRVQAATARMQKRLAYAAELDGILEQKAQDPSRPV